MPILRRIERTIHKNAFIRNGIKGVLLFVIAFNASRLVVKKDMFSAMIAIGAVVLLLIVDNLGRK